MKRISAPLSLAIRLVDEKRFPYLFLDLCQLTAQSAGKDGQHMHIGRENDGMKVIRQQAGRLVYESNVRSEKCFERFTYSFFRFGRAMVATQISFPDSSNLVCRVFAQSLLFAIGTLGTARLLRNRFKTSNNSEFWLATTVVAAL